MMPDKDKERREAEKRANKAWKKEMEDIRKRQAENNERARQARKAKSWWRKS